jgi:hypothetical protein
LIGTLPQHSFTTRHDSGFQGSMDPANAGSGT